MSFRDLLLLVLSQLRFLLALSGLTNQKNVKIYVRKVDSWAIEGHQIYLQQRNNSDDIRCEASSLQ